jgi:hypothetical protein
MGFQSRPFMVLNGGGVKQMAAFEGVRAEIIVCFLPFIIFSIESVNL